MCYLSLMEASKIVRLSQLALCAHPKPVSLDEPSVRQVAAFLENEERAVELVEAHAMAPLVYAHLRSRPEYIPPAVKLQLQALFLRHRLASQARVTVLRDVLQQFDAAGITPILLKGAALAHLVYAEPGLRPMRDMDILVRPAHAISAQLILTELGFATADLSDVDADTKHLPVATKRVNSMTVSIEIHQELNEPFMGRRRVNIEELFDNKMAFNVDGLTAYSLAPTSLLHHVCQHTAYLLEPMKMIWCADIVGVSEQYAGQIDWDLLRRFMPSSLGTLSAVHFLVPLSEPTRQRAGLVQEPRPQDVGLDFEGWPRVSWKKTRAKPWAKAVKDTFFPGEWWLRLYYGVAAGRSIFATRWMGHPLHILSWPPRVIPIMQNWRPPGWYRRIFWRQ